MTLSVSTERALIRTKSRSIRHVVARIAAPKSPNGRARPAVNLAFVLDRSGSMADGKIDSAKTAILRGLDRLEERDRFAIVAYDNEIDVIVPSTAATKQARARAASSLREIAPRGGTDLGEGWLRGCGQVADHLERDVVGRVLLLTDGLANAGITDPAVLCKHAEELRRRGVSTSTFGVGADFDEGLLGRMADAGGGTFRFIDKPEKIVEYIALELGDAIDVVAREVFLEIAVPAGVEVQVVGPYTVERGDDPVRIALPDLVSGQELEIVLQLKFPHGKSGDAVDASFRLADRGHVLERSTATLQWHYADSNANDAQPRDRVVDRLVAERHVATAREAALLLNRDGHYEEAAKRLRDVARKVAEYAGDDAALVALVATLREEAEGYRHPVAEMERKQRYFASSAVARSKTSEGTSRRG